MGPFLPLFSLEVAHSYFTDGVCQGLGLAPTPASARQVERIGGLVRRTDRGLVLAFDASKVEALRLQAGDPDDPLRFDFLGRSSDPSFANYTDLPVGSARALTMLDSRRAVHEPATGHWRLHLGANAGEADLRGLDSPEATDALSVHERRAPPHFAVSVTIEPADVDAAAASEGRRYVCRLAARATVWKYCLFGDFAEAGGDLQVVDTVQACPFDDAVGERLPDGQAILAVRSRAPIALQDRSERRFQLRQRTDGTDKVLVKRLPVASPRQISREVLGGVPTLVSEIYVHR